MDNRGLLTFLCVLVAGLIVALLAFAAVVLPSAAQNRVVCEPQRNRGEVQQQNQQFQKNPRYKHM